MTDTPVFHEIGSAKTQQKSDDTGPGIVINNIMALDQRIAMLDIDIHQLIDKLSPILSHVDPSPSVRDMAPLSPDNSEVARHLSTLDDRVMETLEAVRRTIDRVQL